jgi:hypothetical protein
MYKFKLLLASLLLFTVVGCATNKTIQVQEGSVQEEPGQEEPTHRYEVMCMFEHTCFLIPDGTCNLILDCEEKYVTDLSPNIQLYFFSHDPLYSISSTSLNLGFGVIVDKRDLKVYMFQSTIGPMYKEEQRFYIYKDDGIDGAFVQLDEPIECTKSEYREYLTRILDADEAIELMNHWR